MGDNVGQVNAESLMKRAREIQSFYVEAGMDVPETFTDKKTGAIFTYTKDPVTGKFSCKYHYDNIKPRDVIIFDRATVPTAHGGLGYLNEAQMEEFKENHPTHFYATEYMASADSMHTKNVSESYLNSYDKPTRKAARKDYQEVVKDELIASGTFDTKSAGKLSKYAKNDAIAGQRAATREVYFDKSQYELAKKRLDIAKKAAKERIEIFNKSKKSLDQLSTKERVSLELDYYTMESTVEYIKDKDVRKYIASHPDRFFENGRFSQEKYKAWAEAHLQGDNTMTTSESKQASIVTGLSEKDMKSAVRYAGYDAQKDYTVAIEVTKSVVGLLSGPLLAWMTTHNVHDVKTLKDLIVFDGSVSDPNLIKVTVNGEVLAIANNENIIRFKNVAMRNAAIASALAVIFNNGLVDPKKARDTKAEGITAATIATQNIFRGNEETRIDGQFEIDLDGIDDEDGDEGDACYEIGGDQEAVEGQNGTPDEDVYDLKMNEKGNVIFWYQTADAYNIPKGLTKQDIYWEIRRLNGDPEHNKYAPDIVGLPKEITVKGVKVTRKEQFDIKGKTYTPPKGKGKGKARQKGTTYVGYKGTPGKEGKPGNYCVYDCTDHNKVYVSGLPNEQAAIDWIDKHQKKK